jgi:hypothetical protein
VHKSAFPSVVSVPVVDVWVVWMPMDDRFVDVRVGVRLVRQDVCLVVVLVVFIVDVPVSVLEPLVLMLMLVALCQVQPGPDRHQDSGGKKARPDRLAQDDDGDCGAEERRQREVGAGARRPEIAKCPDEEYKAHAVTQEAYGQGADDERGRRPIRSGQPGERKVDAPRDRALDRCEA